MLKVGNPWRVGRGNAILHLIFLYEFFVLNANAYLSMYIKLILYCHMYNTLQGCSIPSSSFGLQAPCVFHSPLFFLSFHSMQPADPSHLSIISNTSVGQGCTSFLNPNSWHVSERHESNSFSLDPSTEGRRWWRRWSEKGNRMRVTSSGKRWE